jgi:hypothetical protein
VDHLRANGFTVEEVAVDDLSTVKSQLGVPPQLEACHTATVGGYVIEGHVPAEDVKRLLAERPATRGLAVPGMPLGSPGMEVPGRNGDPYDVMSFDQKGETIVFASH